ncbi:hypothetical protein ZWY2020_046707 [Hordeum vulgare]|nr:hypothetical protein ZWY2020_046707 [Hordeum vulgare]
MNDDKGSCSCTLERGGARGGGSAQQITLRVNESQEHQKKTLHHVVEEALHDAPGVEAEVLYPGYVQHNNDEEDAADKEYNPVEVLDGDDDEKQEDVVMGVFEDAKEDKPVKIYDRENPCIDEALFYLCVQVFIRKGITQWMRRINPDHPVTLMW